MEKVARVDIQTKILLLLVSVIVPTFLLVTLIQNKVTQPILEQEMRQVGISTAEALEFKILTNKSLTRPNAAVEIESEIQELLYLQPSVLRVDVYTKEPQGELWRIIASNVEGESGALVSNLPTVEGITSVLKTEDELSFWEIHAPIRARSGVGSKAPGKLLAVVHVLVSTRTVTRVLDTFWRVTWIGAAISVVILIVVLSYFLRRAVLNERLLRRAESENVQLTQQLHQAERDLMNIEKLAIMGQLTANFAHEIGTPLNAIGGHVQLLKEELAQLQASKRTAERIDIISGELLRIENIVKGFLQTTAKPISQKQLVDVNSILDRTIGIVRPRIEGLSIELKCVFDRKLGPLRMVPSDLEQILLNIMNNAIDSLQTKRRTNERTRLQLQMSTHTVRIQGREWAEVLIYDTGIGISKEDLKNVMKPFFTTKRPGEGTGLGLSISRELAMKYGGVIEIEAKVGAWAEVKLKFPFGMNV